MRKFILLGKLLVIVVLVTKLATLGGLMGGMEGIKPYLSVEEAIAEDRGPEYGRPAVRDVTYDILAKERDLLRLLAEREESLIRREEVLIMEEQRLAVLKQEILLQIDVLSSMLESIRVIDDKQYTDLAKIYESTPPAQAGAMLEQLEKRTAAAIIMRMRSKQAGEIWGHINPGRAAAITREIADFIPYAGGDEF